MTIGQVSELLAVPVTTLRSWEQRYQVPPRTRPDGATRRYTSVDVQMLALLRDDTARGVRAADAARSVYNLFDADSPARLFVAGLLNASERPDADLICDWLNRAEAELGLGACLDEVLFPAMRQIGSSWRSESRDVALEQVSTDAVCSWLRDRAGAARLPEDPPSVLLIPADQHNIGLHALGVLLRDRQVHCHSLAPGLSHASLRMAVRTTRPGAVVLLSHLSVARGRAVRWLGALHGSGAAVFYAGNAFASSRSRRGVPGRYLGLSLRAAADLIEGSVSG